MRRQNGFTLVELLISLVLVSLITVILFTVFRGQERGFQAQTEVSQMQQTIRASMEVLTRDLHNLGVDNTESDLYGFSVTTPPIATQLFFTADLNEDGGVPATADLDGPLGLLRNETFDYSLFDCDPAIDFDGDGTTNNDSDCLRRRNVGSRIADNIEGIEFRYLLSDGITPVASPINTTAKFDSIAFVEVSMLVRANQPDPDYNDGGVVYNAASGAAFTSTGLAGTDPANYRRRLFISRVRLRN